MISLKDYYGNKSYAGTGLERKDILSSCCKVSIIDIAGSYAQNGYILNGYVCAKCGKHLYKLQHFIKGFLKMTIISKKCGKLNCVNYYPKSIGGANCCIFSDRTECSISMKNRRKNKNHSRRIANKNMWS